MKRRLAYWHGRVAGYWEYKVRPRLCVEYVRGYLAGWLGK